MNTLAQLENMARLSGQMVVAAKDNDWATLADLEHRLALDRSRLEALDTDGRQALGLSVADRQRQAALIQRILADGQEVLSHVLPYQESLRRLLSSSNVGRTLRQTYAVGP